MDGPARELTPDEMVEKIESVRPRKGKVTIYQGWPRMILERERKRAEAAAETALDVERLARAVKKVPMFWKERPLADGSTEAVRDDERYVRDLAAEYARLAGLDSDTQLSRSDAKVGP